MTPNPVTPFASAPARALGREADETAGVDDLGYECAMPYLWFGIDATPAGLADLLADLPDGDDPR